MAFPQIGEIIATDENVSSTQIDIDLGSSIEAGDLLLVGYVQADTADEWNAVSGWEEFVDVSVFASGRMAWSKRIATGSEGSSLAVPFPNGSVLQASGLFVRIPAASWSGDLDEVEAGGPSSSIGSSPNPGSYTASWGSDDNLWLATVACDDDDEGLSGYPAGYSNQTLAMNTNTDSQQCRIAVCTLESATDAENPGAFTLPSSEQYNALTMVVRGAAGGGGGPVVPPLAMHHYATRR
jgi:hypothetical protein